MLSGKADLPGIASPESWERRAKCLTLTTGIEMDAYVSLCDLKS